MITIFELLNRIAAFIAIALLSFTQVNAQVVISPNGEAVTKQDALDFINKVINKFPATPPNSASFSDFKEIVNLDGCLLIVTKSFRLYTDGVDGYGQIQDSIILNLASGTYDEKDPYPNLPGTDIYTIIYYKKSGKINNKRTEQIGGTTVQKFADANIFALVDFQPEEFTSKDYIHRFPSAFVALIQLCGGKKTGPKQEPKDKF